MTSSRRGSARADAYPTFEVELAALRPVAARPAPQRGGRKANVYSHSFRPLCAGGVLAARELPPFPEVCVSPAVIGFFPSPSATPHLEYAVVVLRIVSGMKIRGIRASGVAINPASHCAQIFLTLKMPDSIALFDLQRHGVTKIQHLHVGRAKPGCVDAIGFTGHDAAQLSSMRVDIAQPISLPTSSNGILRSGQLPDPSPFAIETGTTAH